MGRGENWRKPSGLWVGLMKNVTTGTSTQMCFKIASLPWMIWNGRPPQSPSWRDVVLGRAIGDCLWRTRAQILAAKQARGPR